jgi:hypothetical protein
MSYVYRRIAKHEKQRMSSHGKHIEQSVECIRMSLLLLMKTIMKIYRCYVTLMCLQPCWSSIFLSVRLM